MVGTIFRPDPGIGCQHAIEGQYFSAPVLVTDLHPDPNRFIFAIFYNTVSEFGMVRDRKFFDINQHHIVSYNVMAHETDLVDNHIVSQVATDDGTVVDTNGHA